MAEEVVDLDKSLSFDLSFSTDVSSFHSFTSSNRSKNISLNDSLSAIKALLDEADSEVEPDSIDEQDYYIPQSNVSELSEDSAFDLDIAENIMKLSENNNSIKEVNAVIVNYWYDVTTSDIGVPAEKLTEELQKHSSNNLTKSVVENIFFQLDDIRTTIKTESGIFKFFVSCYRLFQYAINDFNRRNEFLEQYMKKIVEKAIESAATIFGSKFVLYLSELMKHEIGTNIFNEELKNMKHIQSFFFSNVNNQKTEEMSKFLFKNIIEYVDCAITNMIITNKLLVTLNEFVLANTNLSYIESEFDISLTKFRQALLVVMANEIILSDQNSLKELVPQIPSNFIYFLLCMLKPDESMTDFISYKKLEHFAHVNNCNFGMKCEEFLLHPNIIDIPECL